jgi:RND family efflux transporter MFP subunit
MLRHTTPPNLKKIGLIAGCVAIAVAIGGIGIRLLSDRSLAKWTEEQAVPTVQVIRAAGARGDRTLVLPGDVQAFSNAQIRARVSGYLKKWYADIGTPVKQGQLLAEIDAPDLDQQLMQARADLATATANRDLSESTARRWTALLAQNAVSQQDADQKNSDLAAKNSLVNSARANVQRLSAMTAFKRITAPFDGVVTTRSVDVGSLVNVGTANDTPLFTVTDDHRIRVYVRVPQSYAPDIANDTDASFTVPEYPGRTFNAKLVANAGALNTQTGTLLIQLDMDNADRTIKPGSYAQVTFELPQGRSVLRLPATALIFRDSGMAVATVTGNNRVVIKPITIRRDLGTMVEIASGVTPQDSVIDNPVDSIRDGDPVRVAEAKVKKAE